MAGFGGGKAGADREAAAERLRQRHDVGRHAGALVSEDLAGAAHAALHLVEDQQQAVLVAQFAQGFEELRRRCAHTALALHGLDHDRRGLRADRLLHRIEVAERDLVEALDRRAEPFEIFLLAAGGDGRKRTAVERAFESDDAIALGLAAGVLVFACHLDRALDSFRAGVCEECDVGEARLAQPVGEPLAVRHLVEIGDVPDLAELLGHRLDEMRMAVTEAVHRNARAEIEIALAGGGDQPDTFAALERDIGSGEDGKQMRLGNLAHGDLLWTLWLLALNSGARRSQRIDCARRCVGPK